ncbi:CCA tRNA nucleotidyltransferase [Chloroflexota bacterium]
MTDEIISLTKTINRQLPVELLRFLQKAEGIAAEHGYRLYLIGGVVRDLLLGESSLDIDIAVEGNAINLAEKLTHISSAKITAHPRFKTATLKWEKWNIDLTTTRRESYARPGALPEVEPSNLINDFSRRDFTINAMAVSLNFEDHDNLIDLHRGRADLQHKIIRILHGKSFVDDATRIWRTLRYEQRLNFQIDPETLRLLQRDINMLDTISGDRIRYELECVLEEAQPEKTLCRAGELGVLAKLSPALKGDKWLAEKFGAARKLITPKPPLGLYFALLCYRMAEAEATQFTDKIRLSKVLARTIMGTVKLKNGLQLLENPGIKPSDIYQLLRSYLPQAVTAASIVCDNPAVQRNIRMFKDKLRYIRPSLTGNDLQNMGFAPGPRMKETLERLHRARLNGEVASKEEEKRLAEIIITVPGQLY